jgi:hypothetical protein
MKPSTVLPWVLLGASVLLNAALLARQSRMEVPAPAVRAPRPVPIPAEAVVEARSAGRTAALEARIRELEVEKAIRAEPAAAPDRAAGFREKLPRAMKLWRDPRAMANASPEALLELSEISMEFQRARLGRWKDPRTYLDMVQAVLEQTAIESKAPLSEIQRDALRRTLDDYQASLAGMAEADVWERYLHEVGPEADLLQRLRSYVTPEQEAKVMAFGALSPWTASAAPWVDRSQAEMFTVQAWTSAYGLEDSQKAAVTAAARIYVNAMNALNDQMGLQAVPGRETPEWRRRCAQILVDVLGNLESSLTPEQRDRLRQRRPAEVRVFDQSAMQRLGR